MKDALTASPLPTCCDSPRPLSCWSLEDGRVGEPCDGVVGGLDDLIDVDVEGLHPGRAQPTRIRSFEHKRGRKDLGAKLGANDRSLQATSGHNQITSVQLDDSLSDTRRHTATLRRCLLSSGSRVRILPGALLSFPRSTGYEPSHSRTQAIPRHGQTGRLVRICRSDGFFAIAATPCHLGSGSPEYLPLTSVFARRIRVGSQPGSQGRPGLTAGQADRRVPKQA
jgi:hypothetical protein